MGAPSVPHELSLILPLRLASKDIMTLFYIKVRNNDSPRLL
jgi:hypothetical protein